MLRTSSWPQVRESRVGAHLADLGSCDSGTQFLDRVPLIGRWVPDFALFWTLNWPTSSWRLQKNQLFRGFVSISRCHSILMAWFIPGRTKQRWRKDRLKMLFFVHILVGTWVPDFALFRNLAFVPIILPKYRRKFRRFWPPPLPFPPFLQNFAPINICFYRKSVCGICSYNRISLKRNSHKRKWWKSHWNHAFFLIGPLFSWFSSLAVGR